MFLSGHYAGQDLVPKFRGGEPWKKVFGPVYIYLNSGSTGYDPLLLWEDAKIKVCLIPMCLLYFFCLEVDSIVHLDAISFKIKTDMK